MKALRLLLTVLITLVLSHSSPSEAGVGKLMKNQTVVKAGLVVIATGVTVGAVGAGYVAATCYDLGCLGVLVAGVFGGAVALVGLVVLDGEQGMKFALVGKSDAMKIGMTESEQLSYNRELDEANVILAQVTTEISSMEMPSAADSARIWMDLKDLVSPETFSAMQKIAAQK